MGEQQIVMTLDQIRTTVRQFVVTNFLFGVDSAELASDTSFLQSGVIDSTGILEMIQFVEATYDIHIGDAETVPENLDSLDNVARFVLRKKTGSAGGALS